MKSYCPSCGEAAEYSLKKPTFCPHCGKTMEFSSSTASNTVPNNISLKTSIINSSLKNQINETVKQVIDEQKKRGGLLNPDFNQNNDIDSSDIDAGEFADAFNNEKPEDCLVGRRQSGIKLGELGKAAKTGFTRTSNEVPKGPKNKKAIADWMKEAGKTRRIEIDDNTAPE